MIKSVNLSSPDSLAEYLKKASESYYDGRNIEISDSVYDSLLRKLEDMDPNHPYLREVGSPPKYNKVRRDIPMGTLRKVNKWEDLESWLDSRSEDDLGDLLVSLKYDGFGVELYYNEQGMLERASTRGDGYEGEDVTTAMSFIAPLRIETCGKSVTIRGEAIIPRRNHETMRSLGYTAMRNAVPGIVRSCNFAVLPYVDFILYEILDNNLDRVEQRLGYSLYFDHIEHYFHIYWSKSQKDQSIQKHLESVYENRDELDYEIDGIVFKTRLIDPDDDYLNPKTQIAWKFKSNREVTTLRSVEYQMGVTGRFTPIGVFDPVEFQGATLTRASLGNITRMFSFKNPISIGSLIEVSRRGDIIPYIEDVITTEDDRTIDPLIDCPYCGHTLDREEEEFFCSNRKCSEQVNLRLTNYVSSIGVRGLGRGIVTKIIEYTGISEVSDLYRINPRTNLNNIPGIGDSVKSKYEEFLLKEISPLKFLSSYPFIDLGEAVWKKLLELYDVHKIISGDLWRGDLINIRGIGESKINSILSQLAERGEDLLKVYFRANIRV